MRRSLGHFLLFLVVATPGCRRGPFSGDAGAAQLAASDLTPARKPPKLRDAHPHAPPLPDLPALASHEAPAEPPRDANLGDQPCRAVWTGSSAAPLACAKALLFGSDQGKGAVPLVPRKLLSRSLDALPAVADHRLEATEGPTRDQGSAPACTAFATATAVDHALARWSGRTSPVSVMQIWSRYHSPYVDSSLTSNVGLALGAERGWPWSVREAIEWIPCSDFAKPPRGQLCSKPVDDGRERKLEASPVGEFTEVEYLGGPDVGLLQAKLAAGQDVIVTMELPSAFVPKGKPGSRYIPNYDRSAGADAGHALVLAGYARLPHGVYFLAHNSWGPAWGDDGYAWIHETTLTRWAHELVAVDAEPAERGEGSRPRRARGETACQGDLVPDSIRGTCSPACPDHSPRHDGVCAIAGQCPPAYVNLTGACVLAAPTASDTDSSTGISWTCGPGGCSYVLPRDSDPSCTGGTCKASCPAPDFHVARMGDAIVCVE